MVALFFIKHWNKRKEFKIVRTDQLLQLFLGGVEITGAVSAFSFAISNFNFISELLILYIVGGSLALGWLGIQSILGHIDFPKK